MVAAEKLKESLAQLKAKMEKEANERIFQLNTEHQNKTAAALRKQEVC